MNRPTASFCFFLTFLVPLNLFFTSNLFAHEILFYYNSQDGTDGALLQCVTILQKSGNHVVSIDVNGKNRNPTLDNWGAPFDQVWDMRFVNQTSLTCGSGRLDAADYFDSHWRSKAVSFLNQCGKLFVAAEFYPMVDRNEGIYPFLMEIQAVKKGYVDCPPSSRGNSSTNGEAYYPVHHGLGPVSFYGDMVGGIPLGYLTGTNFVDTGDDWEGDHVDRSVVSGWRGNQLGGAVTASLCNRGNFFMVWDATMWTLWQHDMYEGSEDSYPIWDDSAWTPGNMKSSSHSANHLLKAKKVTEKFFPAIANWLGNRDCPCIETNQSIVLPIDTPAKNVSVSLYGHLSTPITAESILSADSRPTPPTQALSALNAPSTIFFSDFPINIYMLFRDGIGEYQLNIFDSRGYFIRTIFEKFITNQKDSWASWDGTNRVGMEVHDHSYSAILYKEGHFLRKLILCRVKP